MTQRKRRGQWDAERIYVRLGGAEGQLKELELWRAYDGSLKVFDPAQAVTADPLYVAQNMDDLAAQVARDGNQLVGYEEPGRDESAASR